MALALGQRPRPKVPVPFITPWLLSLWIGLRPPSTPASHAQRPLIEVLSTETIFTDDSARRLFDIEPAPFEATLRQTAAEDKHLRGVPSAQRDALLGVPAGARVRHATRPSERCSRPWLRTRPSRLIGARECGSDARLRSDACRGNNLVDDFG